MSEDAITENSDANEEVTNTGAGDESTQEKAIDYEKRYMDLRSEFDRRNSQYAEADQFLSQLRDPETQAEALARLGLELDAAEDADDYDEIEVIKRELVELKQARQADTQSAQEREVFEAHLDNVFGQIDSLEGELGRELDEEEAETLMDIADARAVRGEPFDIKELYESRFDSVYKRRQGEWMKSKKAPRVMSGQSASKQPDLDNEQERQAWMQARMAASDD
jgi:hypothetical protein